MSATSGGADGARDGRGPVIEVRDLRKTYGSGAKAVTAIDSLSFAVAPGEFVSVVGPSGCGKTTLLRCLSGLLRPTAGELLYNGAPIDGPPRELAVVFQDYSRSLMPWLTAEKNVAFPLRNLGVPRRERLERARAALDAVGVGRFAGHHPWQMSGGMQQRVAIARALAYRPEVLLMDEPFASVDAQTRSDLEDLVLRVHDELGLTVVFVTHDIDEAVYMGDRVVVLSAAPSRAESTIDVTLPRPRDQVETKEMAEFAHLRAEVFTRIMRRSESGALHA